jgi:DNA-binding NarL/FixJ family response regulator
MGPVGQVRQRARQLQLQPLLVRMDADGLVAPGLVGLTVSCQEQSRCLPATAPRCLGERHVAAPLAEGLSNGEVARRLYVTTKTASVHVSNILAKLGMSSRAEVAAWAVRVGLNG